MSSALLQLSNMCSYEPVANVYFYSHIFKRLPRVYGFYAQKPTIRQVNILKYKMYKFRIQFYFQALVPKLISILSPLSPVSSHFISSSPLFFLPLLSQVTTLCVVSKTSSYLIQYSSLSSLLFPTALHDVHNKTLDARKYESKNAR